MVRVETLTKVIAVIGLFNEATPYDIHSITSMNYESIRATLKDAYNGKTIMKSSENTVELTDFGKDYIKNFGIPKEVQDAFDGFKTEKSKRLKNQIDFLDGGVKDDKDNKGTGKTNKRRK